MDEVPKATCGREPLLRVLSILTLRAGWARSAVLLVLPASRAKQANLGDGFFEVGKRHGAGTALHDQF
jgi:hypothetical protein